MLNSRGRSAKGQALTRTRVSTRSRDPLQLVPRSTLAVAVLSLTLGVGCGSADTKTTTITDRGAVASVTAAPTQTQGTPGSGGSAPTGPTAPTLPAVVVPKPLIIWDPI